MLPSKYYQKMEDSGTPVFGMIPSHWRVCKFQQVFSLRKELNPGDKELLSVYLDRGVIKYSDSTGLQVHKPSDSLDKYQSVYEGDFVLNNQQAWRGSVGVSRFEGIISPAYYVYAISPEASPEYMSFLVRDSSMVQQYELASRGVGTIQRNIFEPWLKNSLVVLPPIDEQIAIAEYLVGETQHIDAIIAEAKTSIEEYKALKASIIYEAVTRGINKDTTMKDSGIEWLGVIPEAWNIVKITRVLDRSHPYPIGDGDHGLIKTTDYVESGIPYIRVQNLGWGTELSLDNVVYITQEKNEAIRNSTLKPNDILFAKTGATIGKTGIVPMSLPVSNTTSHVGKITVSPKYNPRYVFYVLSSMVGYNQFWEIASAKTTRPELSIEEIKTIKITLPATRHEQDSIVQYLDERCPRIDELIAEKEALITDLEAYKKSLIFEVVTGKRKVV